MKLKLFITTFLSLTIISTIAKGVNVMSGMGLMHQCEMAITKPKTMNDLAPNIVNFTTCYSYIDGFLQAYSISVKTIYRAKPTNIKNEQIKKTMFCLPKGVDAPSTHQIILIILKYFKNHPELLNQNAGISVYKALQKTFPC